MTTHKGNAGVARVGANAIAELTRWTVTQTAGTTEDTALGDTARTYLSDGLPTWTASIEGHYYQGDTNGQDLIVAAASLALEFYSDGTGTGKPKLNGTGLITQVQIGTVENGVVVPFSAQIQGTGALTRGVVSP